ncbi:MAG: hypothetical protein J2P23_09845, partial [Microlunatus sp.]|nr:hypothetical protein [Microlunatus sp.]
RTAHYFLVAVVRGPLSLGRPESAVQSAENHYAPQWLPIAGLDREPIVPEQVRMIIRDHVRGRLA